MLGPIECGELGFYVYSLRDKNNIIKYVGKGIGNRFMNDHKSKKMGHIEKQIKGLQYVIEAHKLPNEESSFVLESYLINQHKDTILNAVKGHYSFEWTPKTPTELKEKYSPNIAYRRSNHCFNIIKVTDHNNPKSLHCWVCRDVESLIKFSEIYENPASWPWMLVDIGTGMIRKIYKNCTYKPFKNVKPNKNGIFKKMWSINGTLVDENNLDSEYSQYIGERIPNSIKDVKRCTRFYWDDKWDKKYKN